MRHIISKALVAVAAIAMPVVAQAEVRITEFMYQGANSGNREFFEITNISNIAIDITGWVYNDSTPQDPVSFGSFFGLLGANESIILTEMNPNSFRSYWGLGAGVRIFSIGGDSNMGGSDTLNIYDSASALVDTVSYSGTTRGISRNRPVGATGQVLNAQFADSTAGDVYGSALSPTTPSDIGNPGRFPVVAAPGAVPEPATWAMMIGGLGLAGMQLRRRASKVAFA